MKDLTIIVTAVFLLVIFAIILSLIFGGVH